MNKPSIESDIQSELYSIEAELSNLISVTKTLYENMVTRVLSKQEYVVLRDTYRETSNGLNQQAITLRQAMDDEKVQMMWIQESIHILDGFVETMVVTKKLVERFVERIVVFKDGQVHFDLQVK